MEDIERMNEFVADNKERDRVAKGHHAEYLFKRK